MQKRVAIVLREVLERQGITRYELAKRTETRYPIIDSYYKDKIVRYDSDVLLRICLALDCEVGDIVKVIEVLDDTI